MPIWHVLHPATVYTDPVEKAALAKAITGLYTAGGLPAFYVNVFFHKFEAGDMFYSAQPVGGEVAGLDVKPWHKPFVHFEIDQIAVNITTEERAQVWCNTINEALKPFVTDKGYDWEYHIDETPRKLWRINGLVAPPWHSRAERKWFEENKASEWTKEDGDASA